MDDDDYDVLSDPEAAHPRARELMTEDFFWDCADEEAPFGSDEGDTALHEYRDWRASNPEAPLVDCLSWILCGRLEEYDDSLVEDTRIAKDLEDPDGAFLAEEFDMLTLDATVLATGLAQLMFEGRIDPAAKPYLRVAVRRQLHPDVVTSPERATILRTALRVIEAA
jgi:uncharacterized protein YfeS